LQLHETKREGTARLILRASDVRRDVRRDDPFDVYPLLNFGIPVGVGKRGTVGDMVGSRTMAFDVSLIGRGDPVCGPQRSAACHRMVLFLSYADAQALPVS